MELPEIIPDGFEPVVARRSWNLSDSMLTSINDTPWHPGDPLEAQCANPGDWVWDIVRGGMSLQEVISAFSGDQMQAQMAAPSMLATMAHSAHAAQVQYHQQVHVHTWHAPLPPPRVDLIRPMGYVLTRKKHVAPHENCSCGIYAAAERAEVPDALVRGEVYLWGKVIKGQTAHRAQFAYPKEFRLRKKQKAEQMLALEAFGVPIYLDSPTDYDDFRRDLYDWQRMVEQQTKMIITSTNTTNTDALVPLPLPKKRKRWWNK